MAVGDTRKPIAIPGRIATESRYRPDNSLVVALERVKAVRKKAANPQKGGEKGTRITPRIGKVKHMSWQKAKMKIGMNHPVGGVSQQVVSRLRRIRQDPCVSLVRAPA